MTNLDHEINREGFSLLIIFLILISSACGQIVFAQSSSTSVSVTLVSSAVISYSSPTPTPSPAPTPTPSPSGFLPFTGLAGDYDYSYDGGDPTTMWTTWGQTVNGVYHSYVDWATTALPGYSVSRLTFKFPGSGTVAGYASVLDYATLNTVLGLYNARGEKSF